MSKKIEHKIIDEIECKRCPTCGEWLQLNSFGKDNTKWDNLSSRCKSCVSVYLKEYGIKYNEENKDRISKRKKRWKENNKEEIKRKDKLYREKNREKIKNRIKAYRKTPQGKVMRKYEKTVRRSRELSAGKLLSETIKEVYDENIKRFGDLTCVYCLENCEQDWHLEHKIPLCRKGTNKKDNLTIACPTCNLKKARKTDEEFSNPVTDNTYTDSEFIVGDLDVGDRIGIIIKYNGVKQ